MPELPEVETVRRGLEPVLTNRVLAHVDQRRPDLRRPFPERFAERLTGRRVTGLTRRSKYLLIGLDGGETWIIHLGMSGRILVESYGPPPSPLWGEGTASHGEAGKHDHVIVTTDRGAVVTYNDVRRFGLMDLWPTADLDRLERLNQRLGAAVGGDNVWSRGRILRLPGFINLNHPGRQRAHLLEFHPDLRYSLDELDRQLPQLPREGDDGRPGAARKQYHPGAFDPHWPYPLPSVLQDRLGDFLKGLNLRHCADERFGGPCPLPHRNGASCECDQAFYASPVSGSWTCFCSDHSGQTSGTVRALVALGLDTDLTLSEMKAEIGKYHVGPGEVRHGGGERSQKEDVADRVIPKKRLYPSRLLNNGV